MWPLPTEEELSMAPRFRIDWPKDIDPQRGQTHDHFLLKIK